MKPSLKKFSIFLITVSTLGLLWLFWPMVRAEARLAYLKMFKGGTKLGNIFDLKNSGEYTRPPTDPNFSVIIPKIYLNEPVTANVNPNSRLQMNRALKDGVAHAQGTVFPGMAGTIYIFGHSTDEAWHVSRHNASFYLLWKLKKGDPVYVWFKNRRHKYVLKERHLVSAKQTQFLKRNPGEERLVLQTCWPPGTRAKRLLFVGYPDKSLATPGVAKSGVDI